MWYSFYFSKSFFFHKSFFCKKVFFGRKKKSGPTGIWTRVAGFKVQSDNRYTIGPEKWRIRASIPVPHACKARTLPIELIPHELIVWNSKVKISLWKILWTSLVLSLALSFFFSKKKVFQKVFFFKKFFFKKFFFKKFFSKSFFSKIKKVVRTGLEPATLGLLDQCSTNWANRPHAYNMHCKTFGEKTFVFLKKKNSIFFLRKKKWPTPVRFELTRAKPTRFLI